MDNRQRIIEAATETFMASGIRAMTMDSLAKDLGISKRTIYQVFADKDELLMAVLTWIARRQKDLIQSVLDNSENSIIAIFRLLEVNSEFFQKMSPIFFIDLKKYHNDVLFKRADKCEMPDFSNYLQVIEKGVKEKLFRKDINADIVNRCLYNLGRMIGDSRIFPFETFTRRDVLKNTFINYMRGIATPSGLALINNLEENLFKPIPVKQ